MRKVMLIAVLAFAVMLVVSLSPAAGEEDEAPGHNNPHPGVPNGPHEEPGVEPNGPHNPYPGPPLNIVKLS